MFEHLLPVDGTLWGGDPSGGGAPLEEVCHWMGLESLCSRPFVFTVKDVISGRREEGHLRLVCKMN